MHDITYLVVLICHKSKYRKTCQTGKCTIKCAVFCTFNPNARRQVQKSSPRMAQPSVLLRKQDEKYRDSLAECHNFL